MRRAGHARHPCDAGDAREVRAGPQARTGGPGPRDNHYAVLHHTDCGITDLAAFPCLLTDHFDVPATDLTAKAVIV
ncbi:hypothetical protein ABZ923_11895 [Streptomyces sp. NPDC046881]|uniref:hypothetical protein n=1 Tax=Streptomyces sp. NPDC046881 TaxID=3155374 RepID=UPI003409DD70